MIGLLTIITTTVVSLVLTYISVFLLIAAFFFTLVAHMILTIIYDGEHDALPILDIIFGVLFVLLALFGLRVIYYENKYQTHYHQGRFNEYGYLGTNWGFY